MLGKPQPRVEIRQGWQKITEGADDIRRGVGNEAQLWEQELKAKGHEEYAHAKEGIHYAETAWETRKRQVESELARGVQSARDAVLDKEKLLEQEAHQARKRVDSAVDHSVDILTKGKRSAVGFYQDLEQVVLDQWGKFQDVGTRLWCSLFHREWGSTDIPPSPTWNESFAPPAPEEAPYEILSSSDWRHPPRKTSPGDQHPSWVLVTDDSVLSVLLGLEPPWQSLLNLPQCIEHNHHHPPAAMIPGRCPEQTNGCHGTVMSPGREHLGTRRCVGHFTITQEQLADLGGAWRDLVREIERDIRPKWLSGEWFRTTRYPYTLYFRPNITDTTFRNEQHLRGGMTPKDFLISGPFHRMVIYEPNFVQLDLDLRLLQKQLGDEVSPIILAGAITEYPLEMWVRSLDRPHHELLQWKERSVSHFMDRKLSRLATQWRNKETGVPPDSLAINRWHQEFQENKEHIAKDARNWGDDIQAHCAAIEERLRQGARDVETRGRSLFESGVHQLRPEWSRESPGEVHTLPSDILDHCRRLNTSVDSKPHGGVGYPSLPPSPDPLSKSSISWSELVGSVLLVWVLYHLVRLFFRIHPVQRIPGEHLDWSRSLGHSQPQSGRGVHGVDSTGVSSHPSTKGRSIKTTSATIGNATTATMDRPQSTASDDHGTGPTLQANTLQDPLGLPADGTALTGQWSHLRDILVHFPILILLVTVLEMNHYSTLLSGYLLAVFGCGALVHYYHPYIIRLYPSFSKLPLVGEVNSGLYLMWSSILLAGVVGLVGGLVY